jgi:tetratricopeptide (TPR) repeat protein
LTALARDCLARERDDRPLDASVVAERVATYLSGVQEKLKTSERERAVAEARAVEERKQRRLQLGLAAAVLALTTTGGLGTTYYLQQQSARAAAVAKVLGEASTLRDVALAHPEDVARWQMALAALRQAEGAAAGDPDALRQLGVLLAEVQAGADAAERDRVLLDRLVDIRSAKADDRDGGATDAAYTSAFREAGLDLSALPPAEAGAKVKARPAAVALALATALDDWTAVRRDLRKDPAGADRLAASARVADPDPWRNDLRAALALPDKDRRKDKLKALAGTARFDDLGVVSLDLLGKALIDARELAAAESVLRRAQRRFTGDVWINYDLALALEELGRLDEAIRFYIAARAVRPETAHELAHALAAKDESEEAIEVFRDLTRLRPKEGRHLGCLGSELQARGRSREADPVLERALVVARESIRLKPDDANAHNTLGLILHSQRKPAEAVAALREAIRLKPDNHACYSNLGLVLRSQGKPDEAVAACREAIRLKPDDANAYGNLAGPLMDQNKLDEAIAAYRESIRLKPDDAMAYKNLAGALDQMGKHDEAVVACRTAIRLRPGFGEAYVNLGAALSEQGKPDEAIAAYREAIRLNPGDAVAHYNLGIVLYARQKNDEAAAALRESIRLKPDDAMAHYSLGAVLATQKKFDEAVAACRESIRLKPDDAKAHSNLGASLYDQGNVDEAAAAYREAIRLKPDDPVVHFSLGNTLTAQKKFDAAVAAYRESIRLKPDDANVHSNLGNALRAQNKLDEAMAAYGDAIRLEPGLASAHANLGLTLWDQGKIDPAIVSYRESIRLKPDDALAHSNLGALLCDFKGDYRAAEAAFREAIRLKPDDPKFRFNLGNALKAQNKLDEAVAAYRESIRLQPDLASPHSNLGIVLQVQGKLDAAVAAFREAIRLEPNHAVAHCYLGLSLRSQGDYDGALVALRRGHELGTNRPGWRYPSAQWVAETERQAGLARRLPALLKGEDRPKDVAESLALAQICHDTNRFAAAARFWAGALEADPKLGDDRRAQHRYNAACDAALAAAGRGNDDPPPSDTAKTVLRRQARDYLTAELAAWSKLLEAEPRARPAVLPILQHWKKDADLAGIRDPDALAKLPADEQDAWNALWKDVDALLKKADGGDRP